jgi:RNA polymerase sigma factor (sigma-70 family)
MDASGPVSGPQRVESCGLPMAGIVHGLWWRSGGALPSDLRDDCELEASLALWQARERLAALPEGDREAYAAVCVRRRISQLLRRERRYQARTISLERLQMEEGNVIDLRDERQVVGETLADTRLSDQIERTDVAAAVLALPARDQDILELYYLRDLTDAEIAGRLDASTAAVKVRRRRALDKIRQRLGHTD